jgi:transcriptional regulator with XRE-family HTH domain
MTGSTLGQRIKGLRRQLRPKVSVEEAADAIGIARSTLSSIENDHDVPGRETLIAIAAYYGVSLDWLSTDAGLPLQGPITADEAKLLWLFRSASEPEKAALLTLAERIANKGTIPDWVNERWTIRV